MQRFERSAVRQHAVGVEWPDFLGTVALDEPFVIETERGHGVNGPVQIEGIHAGDRLAVHVQAVQMVESTAPAAISTFAPGRSIEVEMGDACFYFPGSFRVRANPTIGNIGVLPEPTDEVLSIARAALDDDENAGWRRLLRAPRGQHCHRDCPWLGVGATIYLKSQIDGAGLCVADIHGYRPAGEMAHAGIEVAADVQLSVERAKDWGVDWPIVETEDRVMVIVAYQTDDPSAPADPDVARHAYEALQRLVIARTDMSHSQAENVVAATVEIQRCTVSAVAATAPTPTADAAEEMAVVAALPREVLRRG